MDDKTQNGASQLTAAQQAIMEAKAARRAAMTAGTGTAAQKMPSVPQRQTAQPRPVVAPQKPAAPIPKQKPSTPIQRTQTAAPVVQKPQPAPQKAAAPVVMKPQPMPQKTAAPIAQNPQPAASKPPVQAAPAKPVPQSAPKNVRRSGVLEENKRVFETEEIDLPDDIKTSAKVKSKREKLQRSGGAVAVKGGFSWQKLLLCVAVLVFVASAFLLGQYYISTGIEKKNLENVSADVISAQKSDDGTQSADALILQQYAALAAQNSDMVGWMSIDSTTVNAPVMYTPSDPEYYLTHDFEKKYSQSGMLFMDATCIPDSNASNMVIYGHNMKNKTMFSDIESYLNSDFLAEHPVIQFDSLNARAQYQVFAVFELDTSEGNENSMQCYYYRNTADAAKHAYFLDYVHQYAKVIVEEQLPDTGDTLITLSTCDNVTPNGRVVVMAKKVLTAAPTPTPEPAAESTVETIVATAPESTAESVASSVAEG